MFTNPYFLIFIAILLLIVISVSHFYLNKMIRTSFSPKNQNKNDQEILILKEEIQVLKNRIEHLENLNNLKA